MYYNYIEFGLFSLFLQVLKKQPGLFLQTSLPSSALLCRAISCLSMPEQHPVKSVASFLTHLVNTSRSTIRTSTQSNIFFQGSWAPGATDKPTWGAALYGSHQMCWWCCQQIIHRLLHWYPLGVEQEIFWQSVQASFSGNPCQLIPVMWAGTWTQWWQLRTSQLSSAAERQRSSLQEPSSRRELIRESYRSTTHQW